MPRNRRAIVSLKGKHSGARAFIIGNGPSLTIEDLDRLQNEVSFAANKIYLAFDKTKWRPTYYNCEDVLVIEQNYDAINRLTGFTKLLKLNHFPPRWRRSPDTVFYSMRVLPSREFPGFSEDPLQGLMCGYSVTYTSLQWAYYMGFNEMYLLGVDFSFSVPKADEQGYLRASGESNHFTKNYRSPGEKWVVPRLDLQEDALRHAHEWLNARGVRVFNATRGGKLDVFPRVDFDALFR
jgi:hypothetical protein